MIERNNLDTTCQKMPERTPRKKQQSNVKPLTLPFTAKELLKGPSTAVLENNDVLMLPC